MTGKVSALFSLLLLTSLLIMHPVLYAEENISIEQPQSIRSIMKAEKRVQETREILDIVNRIDSIYGNLYENLKEKKQLVIFFDPAHGKLSNGEWQGGKITHRLSCTGRPEEYYSIQLSRKLYKLLKDNPHVTIKSTTDYMKVLEEDSEVYNNIPFSTSVAMAKESNAFIILSEHLNNVSMSYKASGKSNIPGIHITLDGRGRKILRYVEDTYSGFLTLYNPLDSSGFSRQYAVKLKHRLEEEGLTPNSWDFGAVGDDRFSYFVDFPVSIIYESGFISNPKEEIKLADPAHQDILIKAQYEMLLETIEDVFAVDISGREPKKKEGKTDSRVELLKLSRIAVYYTKKGETRNVVNTITTMENKFRNSPFSSYIAYFSTIRKRIQNAEYNFNRGLVNSNKKRRKTARKYFRNARRCISYAPIYSAYQEKYSAYLGRRRAFREDYEARLEETPASVSVPVHRAPRWTPIILAIDDNQSLRDAVYKALEPDEKTMNRLMNSFINAHGVGHKKVKYYSKKNKKYKTKWKRYTKKINFYKGIYIVHIDKNLNIHDAKRISSVHLNPGKYQNQQYLKNSFFASENKIKDL